MESKRIQFKKGKREKNREGQNNKRVADQAEHKK
jgi:hypothetical protein